MADKREQILARLLVILQGVTGLVAAYRDRGTLAPMDDAGNAQLPAAILLDVGERPAKGFSQGGVNAGRSMAPIVMTMNPQIFVVLLPRETVANEGVGEELSAFRVKVLKALQGDASLMALLGSNGELSYQGCETDMQAGQAIQGQIRMDFALSYALIPTQL